MLVLCEWKNAEAKGHIMVECDAPENLNSAFNKRAEEICILYDKTVEFLKTKIEKDEDALPEPSFSRPTDAKLISYIPKYSQEFHRKLEVFA